MISPADQVLRLAIIGGGFTGAALTVHAIRVAERPLSIDIVETASQLGRGAAYGTSNPAHRIRRGAEVADTAGHDPIRTSTHAPQ
jgi:uncharacterized NAD(P)/FAD-binding protein YdhS